MYICILIINNNKLKTIESLKHTQQTNKQIFITSNNSFLVLTKLKKSCKSFYDF
jgi:hypothetical protein